MEVFAGFMSQTDHQIGRLIEAFRETGQFDNTLILFIAGDNGASLEGGLDGTDNIMEVVNGIETPASDVLKHLDPCQAENRTRLSGYLGAPPLTPTPELLILDGQDARLQIPLPCSADMSGLPR